VPQGQRGREKTGSLLSRQTNGLISRVLGS